jgi:hypothetical protein
MASFRDYYSEIEELKPSHSREENLEHLREALKRWRKREGTDARNMENLINSAITLFGRVDQYDQFRKEWEERKQRQAGPNPEDELRAMILGALSDKILHKTEHSWLLDEAKRRGIPLARANALITELATKLGAVVGESVPPNQPPRLSVNCSELDFDEEQTSGRVPIVFRIDNVGGGTLHGTIIPSQLWVSVTPVVFAEGQLVSVAIDPEKLAAGSTAEGNLLIRANGGEATIPIRAHMPVDAEAVRRFAAPLAGVAAAGGGSAGAFLGMLGTWGGVFALLAGSAALGIGIRHWAVGDGSTSAIPKMQDTWRRLRATRSWPLWIGGTIGGLVLISLLCVSVPIAGGLLFGALASGVLALSYAQTLYLLQSQSRAEATRSSFLAWKSQMVLSMGLVSAALFLVAILAAVIGVGYTFLAVAGVVAIAVVGRRALVTRSSAGGGPPQQGST